jgi:hypothetical protein
MGGSGGGTLPSMYSCVRCSHSTSTRLCQRCTQTLDEQLADLPGLYARLGGFLAPGSGAGGEGAVRRVEPPLPVRVGPLSLRGAGGIVGVLADWEGDWRDRLGWSLTPPRGRVENAVSGHIAFLRNNLLWCADQHPAVGEFAREIAELHAACRSEIDGPSDTRPIGYCPTILDDDTPCGMRLFANPYAPVIRCHSCGTSWEGAAWLGLAAEIRV